MKKKLSIRGLLLGAMVADAAAVNCHWMYPSHEETFKKFTFEHNGKPEFMETIYNPFYRGQPSPYGEQILQLIESLGECKSWDIENYKQKLIKAYGPETRYSNKAPVENPIHGTPIQGGWMNRSIQNFMKNCNEDGELNVQPLKNDNQPDGYIKAVILACFYLDNPQYENICKQCIGLTQDSSDSTDATLAVAKLFKLVNFHDLDYKTVLSFIKQEKGFYTPISKKFDNSVKILSESLNTDFMTFALETGVTCYVPGNIIVAFHQLVNQLKKKDNITSEQLYMDTLRKNLAIGGCNASRNIFLGGILGAFLGEEAIPQTWIDKTECSSRVFKAAESIENYLNQ